MPLFQVAASSWFVRSYAFPEKLVKCFIQCVPLFSQLLDYYGNYDDHEHCTHHDIDVFNGQFARRQSGRYEIKYAGAKITEPDQKDDSGPSLPVSADAPEHSSNIPLIIFREFVSRI